jgi:hypothetical protein
LDVQNVLNSSMLFEGRSVSDGSPDEADFKETMCGCCRLRTKFMAQKVARGVSCE